MGWDSEFFLPKNNIFRNEREAGKKTNHENKVVQCAECDEIIGAVSTTLYEIGEKNYCSKCYYRKIVYLAVERDHFDLQKEKEAGKKQDKKNR
ncbi:MAG: hypothetical protein ABSG33_09705 [Candidatus Bathyarchaeia archaeon]|jgi:hypothetical protein